MSGLVKNVCWETTLYHNGNHSKLDQRSHFRKPIAADFVSTSSLPLSNLHYAASILVISPPNWPSTIISHIVIPVTRRSHLHRRPTQFTAINTLITDPKWSTQLPLDFGLLDASPLSMRALRPTASCTNRCPGQCQAGQWQYRPRLPRKYRQRLPCCSQFVGGGHRWWHFCGFSKVVLRSMHPLLCQWWSIAQVYKSTAPLTLHRTFIGGTARAAIKHRESFLRFHTGLVYGCVQKQGIGKDPETAPPIAPEKQVVGKTNDGAIATKDGCCRTGLDFSSRPFRTITWQPKATFLYIGWVLQKVFSVPFENFCVLFE